MKIDVYSNMYNEELMLPYWLRHYETFADRIFVWDGGSNDKTLKILKTHPKVTILPREKRGIDDGYFVTILYPQYEEYSRGVSDWVMIADADEFIYHPHLREVLEKLIKQGVQLIQCAGYSMISEKLPTTNGQIYDEIKMGLPDVLETKWTIHSPNIRIRYRKGRHSTPYDFRTGSTPNFVVSRFRYHGIKLLHYRYLGKRYIESRDKRNVERSNIAYPGNNWVFTPDMPRTCPNGEQINIHKWLAKHKGEAFNVLDI